MLREQVGIDEPDMGAVGGDAVSEPEHALAVFDGELAGVTSSLAVPTLGHGRPVGSIAALEWTPWSS